MIVQCPLISQLCMYICIYICMPKIYVNFAAIVSLLFLCASFTLLFYSYICFYFNRKGLRDTFNLDLDLDLYQILYMLMYSPAFWFGMFITIVMAVLPDILGTMICRQVIPTSIQKAQVCLLFLICYHASFCKVPRLNISHKRKGRV